MKLTFKRLSPVLAKTFGLTSDELLAQFAPARDADFDGVIALRKVLFSNTPKWDDRVYLKWRYDFSEGDPLLRNRFWILKLNNIIVGGVGVEHYKISISGEIKDAYQTMDILVKPEFEGRGLGAWLNLALFEYLPMIIMVGSNEQSRNMVNRLFHPMTDRHVWKLPLTVGSFLQRKLRRPWLATLLALPLDLALRARRLLQSKSIPTSMSLRVFDRFPDEVDALNDINCRHGFHFTCRSAQYLNWRFCDNPRRKFSLLGLYQNDRLIGYSVSRLYYAKENQQVEGIIEDWFIDLGSLDVDTDSTPVELTILMQHTVRLLETQGAHLVQVICYDRKTQLTLARLDFRERPSPNTFCTHSNDPHIAAIMADESRWFISEANSDSDGF